MADGGGKAARRIAVLIVAALVPVAGGCSSPTDVTDVQSIMGVAPPVPERPVDVYTRLARTIKTCWFRPGGLMHQGYKFAAEVAPTEKGGKAAIEIFVATPDGERGLRAFAVDMVPSGETGTRLTSSSPRFPGPAGQQMRADVDRWAGGETACAPAAEVWGSDQVAVEAGGE